MAENVKKEDPTVREAIETQIGYLTDCLDELSPGTEEYQKIEKSRNELLDRLIKINEVEFKAQNEVDQREHEAKMKAQEEAETKRWHTIDMCLRISSLVVTVLTVGTYAGINLMQTRMNYIDNVYDASPASRNLFNAIGKMIKPPAQ